MVLINCLVILTLSFFQYNQSFWRDSQNNFPKCKKEKAGIYELTHEGLQALINQESSLNQHDECGNTPLMYATALEDIATLMLLIKARANLDIQNKDGNTALHISALLKKLEAAKVLINAKAELNAQNIEGQTPLHLAIAEKEIDLIPFLISHGAHLAIAEKDKSGKTPYDVALALNDPKISEIVENFKLMENSREGEILAELKRKNPTLFQRYPKTTLIAAAWLTTSFMLLRINGFLAGAIILTTMYGPLGPFMYVIFSVPLFIFGGLLEILSKIKR
jgi:ankyrin repeat protein